MRYYINHFTGISPEPYIQGTTGERVNLKYKMGLMKFKPYLCILVRLNLVDQSSGDEWQASHHWITMIYNIDYKVILAFICFVDEL